MLSCLKRNVLKSYHLRRRNVVTYFYFRFVVCIDKNADVQVSWVSVADPADLVVAVQIFGVGIQLDVVLAEFKPNQAQDHGLQAKI